MLKNTFRAYSQDSSRLVSASGGNVRIWDVESGECIKTLTGHTLDLKYVVYSPDGSRLVSAGDETMRLWDVESGKCMKTFTHEYRVFSVVFSADGNRLISGSIGTIYIWDIESGQCIKKLMGHGSSIDSVVYGPDDSRIASSGSDDKTARIWDTESGECLKTFMHKNQVQDVVYSPDGSRLTSNSGGYGKYTVSIWDTESGECLKELISQYYRIESVVYSADGSRLITASEDKTVRIWDTENGECIEVIEGSSTAEVFEKREKVGGWAAALSPLETVVRSVDSKGLCWFPVVLRGEQISTARGPCGEFYIAGVVGGENVYILEVMGM